MQTLGKTTSKKGSAKQKTNIDTVIVDNAAIENTKIEILPVDTITESSQIREIRFWIQILSKVEIKLMKRGGRLRYKQSRQREDIGERLVWVRSLIDSYQTDLIQLIEQQLE